MSGIPFNISGTDILGNKVKETVTTEENGQIKEKLLPATYLVKELPMDRYVTPSAQYVSGEENTDEPNEGVIERPEAGAVFGVYLKAAGSYESAKESERDLLTTDGDGFSVSKMLAITRFIRLSVRKERHLSRTLRCLFPPTDRPTAIF